MKTRIVAIGLTLAFGCGAESDTGDPVDPGKGDSLDNFSLWSEYCVGEQDDVTVAPIPNYDNPEVMDAAEMLTQMDGHSFALYYRVLAHYKKGWETDRPDGVDEVAHKFLVYLCGEFRDRATMVQAKVRWVNRTNYLSVDPQEEIDPLERDPFLKMRASTYQPYLDFSYAYYNAKKQRLATLGKHTFGNISSIDRPVQPVSVCETRYIFSEYLDSGQTFPGLDAFESGYEAFADQYCVGDAAEDRDYYYDFRGDGNFKPNSPESNGMIWHSISTVMQCSDQVTARTASNSLYNGEQTILLDDADCEEYFRRPFASRWAGARAGLASWTMHAREWDPTFNNSNNTVTITPNWERGALNGPHDFIANGSQGTFVDGWESLWEKADLGMYDLTGAAQTDPATQQFIYERLRNAVDRHTDWYNSGYDDLMNQKRERDQAYSPFVASSYEMTASDSFVAPCYTIPCNGDVPARHWKHYMFIFKVHKSNFYSTDDLADNREVDFDRMWIDETSFGTTGLAKSERAWDRLGTALEDELDSILYLHHICSDGSLETDGNRCDE